MTRRTVATESIWVRAGASGIVVGLVVGIGVSVLGALAPSPASADTSSAVTVTAASAITPTGSPFPDLAVTVSKTTDLTSEGVLVSWTGAGNKKSTRPQGNVGGENFLQIAQCWGEDPLHPGHPDRTTCQYGAFANAGRDSGVVPNVDPEDPEAVEAAKGLAPNIAAEDEQYTTPNYGASAGPFTAIPFRAASGESISAVFKNTGSSVPTHYITDTAGKVQTARGDATADGVTLPSGIVGVDLASNQFYTPFTSNEIKWAGSDDTGTGSAKFEMQTSMQSPGLGCGQPVIVTGQPTTGQSCWLVIIPRGTGDSGVTQIIRPGLFWDAWQHSVAVKLDFKTVGIRCEIGSSEAQLSGSELIAGAISSWQPELCAGTNGSAFVLSTGSEADSLASAAQKVPGPLAFTSRPYSTTAADPLQYAPVGIAGITVSFAIDRRVRPSGDVPQAYIDAETQAFKTVNLTPRLLAKLLTASYIGSLPPGADLTHVNYTSYAEQGKNAANITRDPEFLKINDPEWAYQDLNSISLSDVLAPSGRSDLATQLWHYVLADTEAVAFLNGTPDESGMIVNPYYSTSTAVNPTGTGLTLPKDSLPKADPVETVPDTASTAPGPVNLVTWRPYASDWETGAYLTLRGDGQALGEWDLNATPRKYQKAVRSLAGDQAVLGLTTTASAARFQNVTASLRNSAGEFVAPTSGSMLAAASAMTPTPTQSKVLEYDPQSAQAMAAPTAYPLTMPVYAALNPLQTDAALRAKYANLITYAASRGQVPGTALGQLPAGYAPMPQAWIAQALLAATAIKDGISPITKPVSPSIPAAASSGATATYSRPAAASAATAVAAAAAPVTGVAADPAATGSAAGPLVGKPTPDDPAIGPVSAAVPAGLLAGLFAAGSVPMISRFRRRF
ncbi:hypothetical protein E3O53_01800 [Cryobacterium sp. TMT2-18-3]|uniref:hypothetical protein n=1 Tax=unclassified Cryobacterium TaxID=2649013 RepID=UPI001069F5F3|nr:MULTISPECIES: hypothetical protein [unclassified Cryobacterium]TFC31633.1 hypothetical protein E3O22_01920 [Cryobacterium sp. TMT2-18-2]TFC33508.1 hypothetical protein E3O18_13475 [Cryobacterium sp. TMT2-42-4]TFC67704.1 hypothetical protein E3O53_01800 [Cryobacterium sp. TMT2-18-3]